MMGTSSHVGARLSGNSHTERQFVTSFFAIERYTPFLVFATGLATLIGLWGTGAALIRVVGLRIPSPWHPVTAILLGIQTQSVAVQILGIAEMALRPVLSTLWWTSVAVGIAMLFSQKLVGLRMPSVSLSISDRLILLPIAIVVTAVATNFFIALAPSTKIDELYYHMLVPSRILFDGALRFYLEPWEAAIWPQMTYQLAAAPTHAIDYPDAFNVVSWGLNTALLWFSWRIIHDSTKSVIWSVFWVGTLCVGIYPAVWHVTGGAHAMGDLAMTSAIIAFCSRERLLNTMSPSIYGAMLSVSLLAAATSKVSLLPVSVVILFVSFWHLVRSGKISRFRQVASALAAPWFIFFVPIALWTWVHSGSPFGPVLAGTLSSSIYPSGWVQKAFQAARDTNQVGLLRAIQYAAIDYSPLLWLGVIGAIGATDLSRQTRLTLLCIFALQCILIYWLLPHDLRFLGGIQYGLLVVFASFAAPAIRNRLTSRASIAAACVAFLLPWLAIQIFYAKQFFPVVFGLEKGAFYQRYVAFYADYVNLDRLLSRDTVLLVQDFRLDAVYAPRPVFFDLRDLPPDKPVVLFASPETVRAAAGSFAGYKVGDLIYDNPQAVLVTYRTPGRNSVIGPLQVVRLIRE
jgi:hypothetical protein